MPHQPSYKPGDPQAQRAPQPTPEQQQIVGKRFGIERIDMIAFDKDPKEIFRYLFGREAVVDRYTGQLVYAQPTGPTRPEQNGPGHGAHIQ